MSDKSKSKGSTSKSKSKSKRSSSPSTKSTSSKEETKDSPWKRFLNKFKSKHKTDKKRHVISFKGKKSNHDF